MALKCTWGALVCATWLLVVVGLHTGHTWTVPLGIQFYVALIAGVALALTGAILAVFDRRLTPSGRTFSISVGVGTVIAVLLLVMKIIDDISKLN